MFQEKNHIEMVMGAGGEAMKRFIEKHVIRHLLQEGEMEVAIGLDALDDSAVIDDWAFTIDGHTVSPYFFPGGDIGRLSVSGTVNDLAVIGAQPLALALGMIVEEGFPMKDMDVIMRSVGETCKEAGVHVVTGDTKVVERGLPGSIFVTTAGIGKRNPHLMENWESTGRRGTTPWLVDSKLKGGDKIIISGTVGDHGIAILSRREGYGFDTDIKSDVMPVNHIVDSALKHGGIVAAKDPTRGGVANTLNEWAEKSDVGIKIYEDSIPIKDGVRAGCEMLGIDPLEIGNEGKVIFAVVNELADDLLDVIRKQRGGEEAEIIGEASEDVKGVVMESVTGGLRIIDPPTGDPVPRIC